MTKIIYYTTKNGRTPVREFLDSLQKRDKSKVFRIFQYIEVYGLLSILPHVKKLTGMPLWEIRILGQSNIRVLFISITNDSILILHGFLKKTQTPSNEVKTSLTRLADYNTRS